jgi:hypothetical protein
MTAAPMKVNQLKSKRFKGLTQRKDKLKKVRETISSVLINPIMASMLTANIASNLMRMSTKRPS